MSMIRNWDVFIFILYCILLDWHVLNISVYASWIHFRRCVCTVCLSVPIIICKRAKYFANCTRPKQSERNKEINSGVRSKNEPMQSKDSCLVCFISCSPFFTWTSLLIRYWWLTQVMSGYMCEVSRRWNTSQSFHDIYSLKNSSQELEMLHKCV